MLNLFRSVRNRLRPVWITFLELFYVFFQHENRFRYKFFDIVQFSRSCAPQPTGWRLDYFITEVIFCQALFSKFFVSYRTWIVLGFSALAGTFGRLLVLFALLPAGTQKSFFYLSAWRSSIIPYDGPDVNTFLQVFSGFFALTQIRFILLYSSGKVFCLI